MSATGRLSPLRKSLTYPSRGSAYRSKPDVRAGALNPAKEFAGLPPYAEVSNAPILYIVHRQIVSPDSAAQPVVAEQQCGVPVTASGAARNGPVADI